MQREIIFKSPPVAVSPQKMLLITDTIKRKKLEEVLQLLLFFPKKNARIIYKILFNLSKRIKKEEVGKEGTTFFLEKMEVNRNKIKKKIIYRAKGRTDIIKKRYCTVYFYIYVFTSSSSA